MGREEVAANDWGLDLGDEESVVNFLARGFDKSTALAINVDWMTRGVEVAGGLWLLMLVLQAWWYQGDGRAGVNKDALAIQRGAKEGGRTVAGQWLLFMTGQGLCLRPRQWPAGRITRN